MAESKGGAAGASTQSKDEPDKVGDQAPQDAEKQTPPDAPAQELAKDTGTTPTRNSGGEYVVIADQITLPEGKTFATHQYGARVKLTPEQAKRYAGGTRPVVVKASDVDKGDVAGAAVRALRATAERRSRSRR